MHGNEGPNVHHVFEWVDGGHSSAFDAAAGIEASCNEMVVPIRHSAFDIQSRS